MRESRFKPNCEPLTPLGKVYRGNYQTMKQQPRASYDGFAETRRVNNAILQEIQGFYKKADSNKSAESLNKIIANMQKGLRKMEQKANRMGIDPEREISVLDNRADEKKEIIEDIKTATFLIDTLKKQTTA